MYNRCCRRYVIHNAHAARNIGQWIGFSCSLDLQKTVSAMGTVDAESGVNDSPQLV